jgi:glyoxylase-like metal-dependent hydrolase (beta-lactamase superfamily II)
MKGIPTQTLPPEGEGLGGDAEKKLLVLPPETIVWPGHDYGETPTSTIGREMEENPYITDFILDT